VNKILLKTYLYSALSYLISLFSEKIASFNFPVIINSIILEENIKDIFEYESNNNSTYSMHFSIEISEFSTIKLGLLINDFKAFII
jgi:hypothetical protein